MTETFHPLVKRLLDGELSLSDLPPELRGEGAEALGLLGAVDRAPVALSAAFETRVMAEVRRRARSPVRRVWRGLVGPAGLGLRWGGRGGRLDDHARAAPGAPPVRLRRGRGAVGSRPRRARRRRRLRAPQQHGCRDRSRSAAPVKQVVVTLALTALVAVPLAAQAPDV